MIFYLSIYIQIKGGYSGWGGNSNSYAGYDIDCDNYEFQTASEDEYYNWNNRFGRNRDSQVKKRTTKTSAFGVAKTASSNSKHVAIMKEVPKRIIDMKIHTLIKITNGLKAKQGRLFFI